MPEFIISYAEPSDAEMIEALENSCFSTPVTAQQILSQIENDRYSILCAKGKNGLLLAYAGMYDVLDEGYITDIAVEPSFRRKHLADALLTKMFEIARLRKLSFLTLEVRESNTPAVALYEKNGFVRNGLRKNYYQYPRENAVIMTKFLSED